MHTPGTLEISTRSRCTPLQAVKTAIQLGLGLVGFVRFSSVAILLVQEHATKAVYACVYRRAYFADEDAALEEEAQRARRGGGGRGGGGLHLN